MKECSDCHHAPSYAHRTCSPRRELASTAEISFPSVRAFQQQHAAMNDVVLLACTTGDLSWLRRGISEGLDPCKRNAEVSQPSVENTVCFLAALESYRVLWNRKGFISHYLGFNTFCSPQNSYFVHVWLYLRVLVKCGRDQRKSNRIS